MCVASAVPQECRRGRDSGCSLATICAARLCRLGHTKHSPQCPLRTSSAVFASGHGPRSLVLSPASASSRSPAVPAPTPLSFTTTPAPTPPRSASSVTRPSRAFGGTTPTATSAVQLRVRRRIVPSHDRDVVLEPGGLPRRERDVGDPTTLRRVGRRAVRHDGLQRLALHVRRCRRLGRRRSA